MGTESIVNFDWTSTIEAAKTCLRLHIGMMCTCLTAALELMLELTSHHIVISHQHTRAKGYEKKKLISYQKMKALGEETGTEHTGPPSKVRHY